MNKKVLIFIGSAIIFSLIIWGALIFRGPKESNNDKVIVSASIYPLVFVAEKVGGDRVQVNGIVPAGAEPHDYEPSARDLVNLVDSDVVVLNGRGLEPWAEIIEGDIDPEQTKLIYVSDSLETNRQGNNGEDDPHVWLNPNLLKEISDQVATVLIAADPAGKEIYEKNLLELKTELNVLNEEFILGLQDCGHRTFITSHAAFGYLADAYNLEQLAISGLEPDEEPSASKLAEITEYVKDKEINYIFFETLASPKLAEVLAKETNTATLVLNPLESLSREEELAGLNYFSEMKNNLNNLRMALDCKIN